MLLIRQLITGNMYLFAATSKPRTGTVVPIPVPTTLSTLNDPAPITPDDLRPCRFYIQETTLDLFNVHMKYNVRQSDQGHSCH